MLIKFRECIMASYIHTENDGSYHVHREGSKLFVYFEKSNGATDWRNNFDFPAKPYRDMKDKWFCHRGFLKVWKAIEPKIKDKLLDPQIIEIEIVGYSHGGAIAQLCYEYVKFNRPEIIVSGYGFGAPRVLWGFASKAVKERFKGFVVVRNGHDIVTHMPPVIFGFRHVGEVKKIGYVSAGCVRDHTPGEYLESLYVEALEDGTIPEENNHTPYMPNP